MSEGSSTAAEQLKPKEKQIENVTGKFRYDRLGYICVAYFQVICHFQMRNKVKQGFSGLTGFNNSSDMHMAEHVT